MNDYAAGKPWKMAKRQHILETAYRLFSERGIERVTMQEVAKAGGVGTATVFRYFTTKLALVVAVGTWKWEDYIARHNAQLSAEQLERMTGAQWLRFYLDAFLDLYRKEPDILRFNYNFNSFLHYEAGDAVQRLPYIEMAKALGDSFHELYERGRRDGTLNTDISEPAMFSGSFHIMLAATTRYAQGLVYVLEEGADPDSELEMLAELLWNKYTRPEKVSEKGEST